MIEFIKRIWRTTRTEKIMHDHNAARAEEVQHTSRVIRKANQVLGNGITIKIAKAVHSGR